MSRRCCEHWQCFLPHFCKPRGSCSLAPLAKDTQEGSCRLPGAHQAEELCLEDSDISGPRESHRLGSSEGTSYHTDREAGKLQGAKGLTVDPGPPDRGSTQPGGQAVVSQASDEGTLL